MHRARDSALLLSLFIFAACADPALPPKAPPPLQIVAPKLEGPDLSPVPEPSSLLGFARWNGPVKGIDRALSMLGVPLSVESLLLKEAPEKIGVFKLDASIDLALGLDPDSKDDDPKVFAAISIPLASFDRARALSEQDGPVEEIRPGVVRCNPKLIAGESIDPSQKATVPGESKGTCDIALSLGDAPARLVCSGSTRELDALRDFMTRGLPRTPPGPDDLTASLRFRPFQDRFSTAIRKQSTDARTEMRALLVKEGIADPELLEAPNVAIDEGLKFFDDLDALDFRTTLSPHPPEIVAGASLRFRGDTSWLTRAITFSSGHPMPAPPMFWRVPKDASSATWGQSQDPTRFEGIRNIVHKATQTLLDRVPLLPRDKAAIMAFLDGVPRTSGPWVSAQGVLRPDKKADKPTRKTTRTPAEVVTDAKNYATTAVGWTLAGVHAPASDYVTWAKLGLDLYQRGAHFAREKATTADQRELLAYLPAITTTTSPPGFPKGTVVFDIRVVFDSEWAALLLPSKKDEPKVDGDLAGPVAIVRKVSPQKKKSPSLKGSITFRLAIVPDRDDAWIGFSADLPALQKRMSAAVTGAPGSATIATRDGLEGLRGSGATASGFFTFGDLLDTLFETMKREMPNEAPTFEALFATMPNKGKTPILWLGSGMAGKAPSTSAEMRLQQGTLTDVAALATFLASDRGRALLNKSP